MVDLGSSTANSTRANNVSGDGKVIVGWQEDPDYLRQHTAGAGPEDFGAAERIPGFLTWNEPWYLWRLNPRSAGTTP